MITEIKNRLQRLDTSKKALRRFGIILGIGLCCVAGIMFLKDNPYRFIAGGVGLLILITGLIIPESIKPFYKTWTAAGLTIGMIITRVILIVIFYFVITPFGLFVRLILKKDLLDEKIDKNAQTYWKKHEPVADKSRYLKKY